MPGRDNGVGIVAAAVPYSWEAAPGKPIDDVVTEPLRTPLPPPPGSSQGLRKTTTFVAPTFEGFAPEEVISKPSGSHFGEKLFKKLQTKLKKKSKLLLASFLNENARMFADHNKRVSHSEADAQSSSYDSDEQYSSASSSAHLSTDSSGSMSSLSTATTSWESIDGSQRSIDMLLATSPRSDTYDEILSGPRECAWHEEDDEGEELTEQEWQIVRYASLQRDGSNLIATLVRQSSLTPLADHSYQMSPIRGRKAQQ